jgi:hypothetical protein
MLTRGDLPDLTALDPRRARLAPDRQVHGEGSWVSSHDPELAVEPTIIFSADALQGACERLSAGDGLHGLLSRFGGDEARDCRLPLPARATSPGFLRRHRASLLVVALYALLAVAPGLLISALAHPARHESFIRFTDWRELPGALFLYLVLAPVIWTLYLWQPRLIVEVFDGLAQGGVIGRSRYEGVTADAFLARLGGSLPRARKIGPLHLSRGTLLALLALAVSVATLVIWPPTALPPFNRLLPESDVFWWRVVPAYFWGIWLPLVFINVYMLVWIVLRQTIMIANIQRLLRVFAVEPVPFHPDRCSGFAPIGSYATNIVRVALIVGSWALVLMLSGPLTGHGVYVAPHILFLVLVQVLLTPYLLLGPVWYAHRVMREARDRALARVAAQIRNCLLASGGKTDTAGGDTVLYRELEAKYQLTGEGYHTWPFQPSALSGVSITAGLTLLGNVAAILYRIYWSP